MYIFRIWDVNPSVVVWVLLAGLNIGCVLFGPPPLLLLLTNAAAAAAWHAHFIHGHDTFTTRTGDTIKSPNANAIPIHLCTNIYSNVYGTNVCIDWQRKELISRVVPMRFDCWYATAIKNN